MCAPADHQRFVTSKTKLSGAEPNWLSAPSPLGQRWPEGKDGFDPKRKFAGTGQQLRAMSVDALRHGR
jgi:hypothetical protein